MKYIICSLFLMLSCMSSGCTPEKGESSGNGDLLTSFRLEVGDKTFHGNIDHSAKTVTFKGIVYGTDVTGVEIQTGKGVSVTPDPETFIGAWPERQVFTFKGESISGNYEVILEDYAEEQKTDKVVFGYVQPAEWNFDTYFDSIDWSSLTHILLSFAFVKEDATLDTNVLDKYIVQLRDRAKANGVKVIVAIRSRGTFTKAISTEGGREKLADNIVKYAKDNKMDGIDIDYEEYEHLSKDDDENRSNLFDLFTKIRNKKDKDMTFSSAILGGTWLHYTKEWHTYFDYVNIMSYDHASGTATPVQHATYDDYVKDIMNVHTNLDVPKHKIVGGVPFYGHSWDNMPGTDDARGITFKNIMDYARKNNIPQAKDLDQIGQTYYNGHVTIRKKCRYAKDNNLAGIMIWQLFQDAIAPDESLLRVIGDEMLENE